MNSNYISKLKIEEFKRVLLQFNIDIDDTLKKEILNLIKNNQYAIINDEFQDILENSIKKLTSENTCQKFHLLINNHFKPLLNS